MELPLRPLLIDCRIELRKALRDFDTHELNRRLNEVLEQLSTATPEKTTLIPQAQNRTAQQVAYAWQSACRRMKASEPERYRELYKEMTRLLDVQTFPDANAEMDVLKADLEEAEHRRDAANLARMKAQGLLNVLYKALATAAPDVAESKDLQETAIRRIQWLAEHGSNVADSSAVLRATELDAPIPSRLVLELVANGQRAFTKQQQEFIVGEAMVLTQWNHTPLELLERGEAWMAQLVLDQGSSD